MSSRDPSEEIPSRYELDKRTQRIETEVHHVRETVERIEENLEIEHEDLAETVEDHEEKVETLWNGYRFLKYAVPLLIGGGGALSYIALL